MGKQLYFLAELDASSHPFFAAAAQAVRDLGIADRQTPGLPPHITLASCSLQLEGEALQENIRQWQVLRELQQHVAMEKMVNHEMLSEDRTLQRTTFSDGTRVTVNFKENTYQIDYPDA